jgi:hypothetical protein
MECDTIGHFEGKKLGWTCAKFGIGTKIELFEHASIKALWMLIKKDKLRIVDFLYIVI